MRLIIIHAVVWALALLATAPEGDCTRSGDCERGSYCKRCPDSNQITGTQPWQA